MRSPLPFLTVLLAVAPVAKAEYQILAHYPIGDDASAYDYLRVDQSTRRIFAAHEKRFEVLDAETGKKIGEIGPTRRAHGIALAPEAGHGFASSGIEDMIIMFDLKTLAQIKKFKSSGANPDSIEYDPETKRVYVANHGDTGDVTVIDPESGKIVATVKLGGAKLEGLGFDGRGQGFVNDEDKSSIHVFDTHTLKLKATWSSAPGEGGTGLAVDAAHHRVFSACGNNKVVVMDSDTGKVIATPAIGEDPDGLVFAPATGRIFSSNFDGTLTIIQEESPDDYRVLETVKTQPGSKTITLDEKTGHVLTSSVKFGPKPDPVEGKPEPKAPILPGTFEVFVIGEK